MSNKAFEDARKAFMATLSLKDGAGFLPCSSLDEVIATLKDFEYLSVQSQKKTLHRSFAVLKRLNDRLKPYFDALNMLASAHTTAALTYGAFRTVLQLASGFPSFFEKLVALLGKLADAFPQYESVIEIYEGSPPPRMQHHLESVYQDLFEFLHITARVFTASSGKVKRPLHMIASIIWKPFDVKFGDIIERMSNHRQFIMDELKIMAARHAKSAYKTGELEMLLARNESRQMEDMKRAQELSKEMGEMRRRVEQEFRDASIQRILAWLAPPRFAEVLENSKDQRQEGTAQWIFENDCFKEWRASHPRPDTWIKTGKLPPWVLWVNGIPGCGKTLLAASVAEELLFEEDLNDQPKTTCYFFFKYNDNESASIEAACRSALAQILHRNWDDNKLIDKFLLARLDPISSSGQSVAGLKELLSLMKVCSAHFGQLCLILDGIDESDEPHLVCSKLKDLAITAHVKIICFSRPNISSLQHWTAQDQVVSFDRLITNSDIRLYFTHQLSTLEDDGMLPITGSTSLPALVETLVHGADGMFLWAKLMIKYLSSPALTSRSRLSTINSVRSPEGLNIMYDRIFTLISDSTKPELELACRTLVWLYHSVSFGGGLTQRILQTAVAEVNEQHDPPRSDFIPVVVSVCGGLVEFSPQARFQLAHLTVKEYIRERAWCRIGLNFSLIPREFAAAAQLATVCVCYLLSYPQQLSDGAKRYEEVSDFQGSFQSYAVQNWGYHLLKSVPSDPVAVVLSPDEVQTAGSLLKALKEFLNAPMALGYWIEGIYNSQASVPDILSHIEHWLSSQILKGSVRQVLDEWRDVPQRLRDLAKEVHELDREWRDKLTITPSLIWDDVSVFAQSNILSEIRDRVGVRGISILMPEAPKNMFNSEIQPLCTISSTSKDGTIIGVLSIFSSSEFEQFWKGIDPAAAYHDAEEYCSGWVAKYNIYSSDSKKQIVSFEISIPEPEILLILRQSFRQKISQCSLSEDWDDDFVTSFPLAIGPDCRIFSILRTIYNIPHIDPSQSGALRSSILQLEFLDHFNSQWASQLATFEPEKASTVPSMFRLRWRNWYKYSLYFSPGGKYIGFADYQKPLSSHLAVFEISEGTEFSIRLVQWTATWLESAKVQQMVFHPADILVAILSEQVQIWDFLKAGRGLRRMPTQFDACASPEIFEPEDDRNNNCRKHAQPLLMCRLQSLTFSQCGNFVVAATQKQVDVLRIPQDMLSPGTPYHSSQVLRLTNQGALQSASNSDLILQGAGLSPGTIIRETHLIAPSITSNSSPKALLVTTADNDLKVQLAGDDTKQVHMLSMPKSLDAQRTSVGLRIPKSSDDSLRVIFNKKAGHSYSLGDDNQGQFRYPMILEREITSIRLEYKPDIGQDQVNERHLEIPPPKRLKVDQDDSNMPVLNLTEFDVIESRIKQ